MNTIQIIGYRDIINPDTGKKFRKQIHFDTVKITDIVAFFNGQIHDVVNAIAKADRYDCHYTTAYCKEHTSETPLRTFASQDIIPFDFDDIDLDKAEEYLAILFNRIGVDRRKCIITNSGHGLHVIVAVTQGFTTVDELNKARKYYVELCNDLTQEFYNNGLAGKLDPQRLSEAATMRLPFTTNMKDKENPVDAVIISGIGTFEPQPFYLDKVVTLTDEPEHKYTTGRHVDTKAVLAGCGFINYCKDNQAIVTEPQWHAMIGTLAYIPDIGETLCHEFSKGHDSYSIEDTQKKIDSAKGFGKPRTCESISQVYPSCSSCPYYNKVKTPLSIKGEDYIKTKDTGFHDIIPSDPPKVVPNYDDLRKFFIQQHTFVVDATTQEVWIYNGTHWENKASSEILNFATVHFKPTAKNTMRSEFLGLIKSTNVVPSDFFNKDNSGHINFSNGVLRLRDKVLVEHSKEFGFTYVLPYEYNPNATCPNFDMMLHNVTCGDDSLKQILLEYIGYAISGDNSNLGAKALILTGEGSNGKSTFLDVVKKLIGAKCFSTIPLSEMGNANARYSMVGKLFNICEEVDEDELRSGTAIFKSIVTGAELSVKKLYSDITTMRIDAKIILACNRLPTTKENTTAIYRRMLIVPFNAHFNKATGIDKGIGHRIDSELSGIYNRILQAYDILTSNNYIFSESEASEKSLEEFKYSNSTYNQFVDDILEKTESEDDFMSSTEIMDAYNRWAIANNVSYRPTLVKLVRELGLMGVLGQEKRAYINGVRQRGFSKIKQLGVNY